MRIRDLLSSAAAAAALVIASAGPARPDVVYLEGGGRIKGEITSEDGEKVVVKTATGSVVVVHRDEIAKIEREKNPAQEYADRAKKISDGDAEGWFQLGKWAASKELKKESEAAYLRAIAFNPDHEGAREALGHRKHNGKWYDDASYKRLVQGLVQYKGKWVTPEEKEKYEQGLVKNPKGEWVRPEDQAGAGSEKKEPRHPQADKPKPPASTSKPSAPKPEASNIPKGKKVRDIEPEDQSWYDDHATVMTWDNALKNPYVSPHGHYRVVSNIKPEYVKRYALMLEVYNEMGFSKTFNAPQTLPNGTPQGQIWIYPTQQEFMSHEQMPDGVGGFYEPGHNIVKCYHGRFGQTGTTRTVLVHEGTHQFEDFVMPGKMWNSPVWIIEGFAVFFESAYFDRKAAKVDIGHIPHDRLQNLKMGITANNYIHLTDLIRTPHAAFGGYHYAHAWSLIYYLVYGQHTEKRRKISQQLFSKLFFDAKEKPVTPEDTENLFAKIYPGGLSAFEEEWKQWLLDLPYDWDPSEGLQPGPMRKDPKSPEGSSTGRRGGGTETPDPGNNPGPEGKPKPDDPKKGEPKKDDPKKDPPPAPPLPPKAPPSGGNDPIIGADELDRAWEEALARLGGVR